MSLVAESPVHSSSRSDFAALLEAELELVPPYTLDEDQDNVEEEDGFLEQRANRHKMEDLEVAVELGGSVVVETTPENIGTSLEPICEDVCPPHPGFIKGMCMRCGQSEDDESGMAFGYIPKNLRLASMEIDRLHGENLKNFLDAKKLILILDLDHTLLYTIWLHDVSPGEEYMIHQADSIQGDPSRSVFNWIVCIC